MKVDYKLLQRHYEACLEQHGPNEKGMDWPNPQDLTRRFEALTEILLPFEQGKKKVLDLGCGVGLYIHFLTDKGFLSNIDYEGIDISPKMIEQAQKLHPHHSFRCRDLLEDSLPANSYDFIIMNGLFTEKRELSHEDMFSFFESMISKVYPIARQGIAFNLMSSHVDWKRDDLFHVDLDQLVSFLVKNFSRRIKINMDYGLYEYTVQLRKP